MTGPGILDDLTTQLADFMALPADLDLPPLCAVRLYRSRMDTAWDADAQLDAGIKGDDVFAAMHDWAVATGGTLTLSKPHYSAGDPFRTLEVTVSHAVLAVQERPGGPVRVVRRSRFEILTSHLLRVTAAALRLHERAGEMRRANDAHMELLLRKSELLAWRWLPKLTKISGQVRGHALAAAYDEGGTGAYLGLVGEVRAAMWNDALTGGSR